MSLCIKHFFVDCECHEEGSMNQTCVDDGVCTCKEGIEGDRCSRCKPNHFNFPQCEGIWILSNHLSILITSI